MEDAENMKCLLESCKEMVRAESLREHCHHTHLPGWMQDESVADEVSGSRPGQTLTQGPSDCTGIRITRRVHFVMWLLQVASKTPFVKTLTHAELKDMLSHDPAWLTLKDFSLKEQDCAIFKSVCSHLGEDIPEQFSLDPPNSVGLCGHWGLIIQLLNRLPPEMQILGQHMSFTKTCGWDMVDAHFHIDRLAARHRIHHGVDRVLQAAPQPPGTVQGVLSEAIANFCDTDEYKSVTSWLSEDSEITLYATIGLHPKEAAYLPLELVDQHIAEMVSFQDNSHVVGIGEIGLDYSLPDIMTDAARSHQQEVLQRIFLHVPPGTPVVIHCRNDNQKQYNANFDVFNILKTCTVPFPVQLHCFNGSAETVTDYLNLDREVYFSLSNHSLNGKHFRQVVKIIPQDRLLVETDSPYLSPLGRRSSNSPKLVGMVAEKVACMLDMTPQQLLWLTSANTRRLFKLP